MNSASAQALALSLAVAIRTAAYYEQDNAVMRQTTALLRSQLVENSQESAGTIMIGVHSHCVFVGPQRIRSTVSTYPRFAYLIELYSSWGIDGLTFFDGLTDAELMNLLTILARDKERTAEHLSERLDQAGVMNVEVNLVGGEATRPSVIAPVEAYAACIQMGQEFIDPTAETPEASIRQLRHVTQVAVDQILEAPQSLIALTTIKDFEQYLIYHSTNVAILSVVLGQRLGLSKSRLGELCLAGILHDIGKLVVRPEVLDKAGPLDAAEWVEMRRHPSLAARSLLDQPRLTPAGMRSVVVAFEHHLHYDMSGYPRTRLKTSVSLFGNIVSLVDVYDAMTTARGYRRSNVTPYEALNFLIEKSGSLFDPMLVKLFAEVMGLYPPGTVVELTTGELAVVSEPPATGTPLDRPRVRVMEGGEPDAILDLSEESDGVFTRDVKHVINPGNKGAVPAVQAALFSWRKTDEAGPTGSPVEDQPPLAAPLATPPSTSAPPPSPTPTPPAHPPGVDITID